jgi:LuxR family maltose regulon positive regulatory protein
MNKQSISITKITRPKLPKVCPRERLFRSLDDGLHKPVLWMASQAGSGKTTLVANWLDSRKLPALWYQVDGGDGDLASFFYFLGLAAKKAAPRYKQPLPLLTPEYLQGVPIFTRRYFEELFRRLKPPAVVVFDNYQDAPLQSGFHEMMAHALDTVPEGITVAVLSRTEPPAQLSRLQANNAVHRLGWEDLRFTLSESRELLKKQGNREPLDESVRLLHAKTEGWAAGLILLMARVGGAEGRTGDLDPAGTTGVFNYFANEIFDKSDGPTQHVLLATAFLPNVTASMAEQLSGVKEAGEMLEHLNRRHYFTQKHAVGEPSYQYHALFREFLLERGRRYFDAGERFSLARKAAALLQAGGRNEDAAALLIEVQDWARLIRLICGEAPTLAAQGRSRTLEDWIRAVPDATRDNNAWLLYWLGVCRIGFDPYESRGLFEKAFERFQADSDATGTFLSWAGIVDTFVYAWGDFSPLDRWISVMEDIVAGGKGFPSPEIEVRVAGCMLTAMVNRQPDRPDIAQWAERVQAIVATSRNAQLQILLGTQLVFYYLWVGDFSRIAVVIDAVRPAGNLRQLDPLTRQNWYVMQAMYSWFVADWATCLQAITDGLKNADDSGIHLLDLYLLAQGVYGGLSLGDPAAASSCLEKMALTNSPRLGDRALYLYEASSVAWYYRDFNKSIEQGKLAIRITEEMGWPIAHILCLVEHSVSLFESGDPDEADTYMGKALDLCSGMNGLEFLTCVNAARFAFARENGHQGIDFLKRGLAVGARHGILNLPRWNNATMSPLLARALEQGIEPEYVTKLIRVRRLSPPEEVPVSDQWPMPVRINTLGGFELIKDDKVVEFTGKRKLLEMLKILIALGGEAMESAISEALWPDADGDLARHSFEMTLSRLRKLTGNAALPLRDGRLLLDRRMCRVDAWAFEQAADRALKAVDTPQTRTLAEKENGTAHVRTAESLEEAVLLYRGHFLPDDREKNWSVSRREGLRSRFIRVVSALGMLREEAGEWDRAAACFQRAIETDDLAEEFYQHLMRCHIALGRSAEAASTYHRCRAALLRAFGLAPSPLTEELYATLRNGK